MLIMLSVFFKKLMSSSPSPPPPHHHHPPPPPNQRIRGAPRSLGGAPRKVIEFQKFIIPKVWKRCNEMERKNCSLTQF